MSNIKARLDRLEGQGDDGRTELLMAWEEGRELDADGLPILTADERRRVAAGKTRLAFILGHPLDAVARGATFAADGQGGIVVMSRGYE